MNKILRFIFLIAILMLIASCSVWRNPEEKRKLFYKNLDSWKNFTMRGVAEVNYKSFAFRKDFVIKSDGKVLRADLISGGMFGASPSPFASVYIDSLILLKPPFGMPLKKKKIRGYKNFSEIWKFIDLKVKENENQLLGNFYFSDKESEIFLTDNYQLKKIVLKDKTKAEFEYSSKNIPKNITVYSKGKELLKLTVDEFIPQTKKIKPFRIKQIKTY
ncbi:MAG: hypothetical protein CSB55_05705 [Candidatus Cloacimonadota bacterium]|nr:MAG: hypothetical protein CSB55_05705 [Candidatus Cloacimonadota bacterium]